MRNGTITAHEREIWHGACSHSIGFAVTDDGTKDKNEEKNLKIIRYLYGVGIQMTSVGFHYFYTAIQLCMYDRLACTNAQKNIYMVIADQYNVSHKSVERAMRVSFTSDVALHAMQLFEKEMRIFSFNKNEEMTPLEFITLAALVAGS